MNISTIQTNPSLDFKDVQVKSKEDNPADKISSLQINALNISDRYVFDNHFIEEFKQWKSSVSFTGSISLVDSGKSYKLKQVIDEINKQTSILMQNGLLTDERKMNLKTLVLNLNERISECESSESYFGIAKIRTGFLRYLEGEKNTLKRLLEISSPVLPLELQMEIFKHLPIYAVKRLWPRLSKQRTLEQILTIAPEKRLAAEAYPKLKELTSTPSSLLFQTHFFCKVESLSLFSKQDIEIKCNYKCEQKGVENIHKLESISIEPGSSISTSEKEELEALIQFTNRKIFPK